VNKSVVLWNNSLESVPFVARIPIVFVLVCKAAGLIAGSIPIIGMLYVSLNTFIALVVAVLQATTISLLSFSIRRSMFFLHNSKISLLVFSP
jgi:hypothetical protein